MATTDAAMLPPAPPPVNLLPVAYDLPSPLQLAVAAEEAEMRLWQAPQPSLKAGSRTYRGLTADQPGLHLGKARALGQMGGLQVGMQGMRMDTSTLNTGLSLKDTTGPLLVNVNLNGSKTLLHQQPMTLDYDSSVMVSPLSPLTLGFVAHGSLGTFRDFAPATDHTAGPVAKLKLGGTRAQFSAETDYSFIIGPGASTMPSTLRLKLNFDWKFGS